MQQPYILFCLHTGLQLSHRLADRDEPQMLIRRDNCFQNNIAVTRAYCLSSFMHQRYAGCRGC